MISPAPLARYVAENFDALPKALPLPTAQELGMPPNEKPGPGPRSGNSWTQFDADTVGGGFGVAADAEICMMAAEYDGGRSALRASTVIKGQ